MNQHPGPAVTRNYSLTLGHIEKVAEMAARTGKSQGEIVRQAIDLLFDTLQSEKRVTVYENSAPSPTAG